MCKIENDQEINILPNANHTDQLLFNAHGMLLQIFILHREEICLTFAHSP